MASTLTQSLQLQMGKPQTSIEENNTLSSNFRCSCGVKRGGQGDSAGAIASLDCKLRVQGTHGAVTCWQKLHCSIAGNNK